MRNKANSIFIVAALLILIGVTPALAASDAPEKTGLPGTVWAVDCKAPASSENFFLTFKTGTDGNLAVIMKGFENDREQEITNIQVISPSWMIYTLNSKEYSEVLTFTAPDGKMRTWRSVGQGGKAYVLDGKMTLAGKDSPWFEKCPAEKTP